MSLKCHHNVFVNQVDKQRYVLAIERILRESKDTPMGRRYLAELIMKEVVLDAVEMERDTWLRMIYAEFDGISN